MSGNAALQLAVRENMTDIYLQPGANVRLSQSLVLDGVDVTIRSSGSITGATIDGTDALDSLFILKNKATLWLEGLVLANCQAEAGGGAVRMDDSDASLRDVRIQDCYAGNSGGAIYAARGSLRLESVEITRCSTETGIEGENAQGLGGAIRIVKVPQVELSEVNITGCSAVKGGALHIDGGTDSETTLNRVRLADSTATEEGGLVYISSGRLTLENGTLLESGTASQGSSIAFSGAPEVSYRLPLPPGHWIPHSRCEIYRQLPASCAGDVCRGLFDKCKTETDAQNDECKQFPVAFVQPCNWEATPALLGVSLYQVPTSALDVDLPYACAPGILGSSHPDDQRSAFCAGLCPVGQRCPEAATTEPRPCTEGNFCPAGTSVPRPCPEGSYSAATNLTKEDECTLCPVGFTCPSGSTDPDVSESDLLPSFRVIATFAASGEVSDFHEEVKASVLNKLKELAGFAFLPLGTMIEVTAGSVVVVVTFPVGPRGEEAVTAQRRLASYSGAAGQERFEEAVSTILATVGASVEGALTVEVKEDPNPTKGGWVSPPVVIPTVVGVVLLLVV